MISRLASTFRKNCIFYSIACIIILVLNALYRSQNASRLLWILAPTVRWVRILSGLRFELLPQRGYVNEDFHFLIAPACSGIRFLQVILLMLVFSYTHSIRGKRKLFWLPFCGAFSYLATVLVNGLRIVLSIYLPLWIERKGLFSGLLTPERLHTAIGTVIYFSSLLLMQSLAHALIDGLFLGTADFSLEKSVFWYFSAVLGLPFIKRLITRDMTGFGQYALIVVPVCGTILFGAVSFRKHFL